MGSDFVKRTIWIPCLMLVLSTTLALGQGIVAGSIAGTVVDPQKAVVVGAKVTAKNLATGVEFKTTSNEAGLFSLRSVPIGTYRVTVEAPNFRKLELDDVTVSTGVASDVGALALALGSAAETITVEGAAPLIETTTAQGGATFSSANASELPLNGGFDQLVLFTPGVVTSGQLGGLFPNSNGASFASNGQRERSNSFQIDGQFNNDTVVTGPAIFFTNQDALQEVQVVTNNFGVEYGRTSGATVNYVTKSGTNNFHGSGFEYYTGNWADSLTHQERMADPPTVARYTENRWGGTIGGPILPNKIFFFSSYLQDTAKGSSSPSVTTLLTPVPGPTGLGQLATCYPGNPGVAALQAVGPFSVAQGNPTVFTDPTHPIQTLNLGGGSTGLAACNVQFGGVSRNLPAIANDYEAVARVDFVLSPKDQLFVRYLFVQPLLGGSNVSPAQFGTAAEGGTVSFGGRNQQAALDWTRNWTTHLVNQVRFSYVRAFSGFQGGGFPDCLAANLGACPTLYSLANGLAAFGQGINVPSTGTTNNSQWQDNASLQRGRHTFKFGGEYDRQRAPNVFLPFVNGRYSFSFGTCPASGAQPFGCVPDPGPTPTTTFNEFLSQAPSAVSLTAGSATIPFKEQDASLYFGDDWRMRENLTLNLGVRWEFAQQGINNLAQNTVAQQLGPHPFWDTSLPLSVTTLPSVPNHYDHFAPSFGFAWTPRMLEGLLGHNKTVVRGGFRMSYDPEFYNIFLNAATAAPAVNAGNFSCGPAATPGTKCPLAATGAAVQAALTGFIPTGVNPGTRANTRVTPNFTNPYAEEWTLGIQREITSKLAAEVRYVGTHTVHEFQTINGNPQLCASQTVLGGCQGGLLGAGSPAAFARFVPAGVTPCADPTAPGYAGGYANCNFTLLRVRENGATGRYDSLQSQLKFQNWHGFTAVAAYTFSKNIDNASEIYSAYGAAAIAGPQNPFDTGAAERSLSALDYPHNLSLFWQYELPFGKGVTGGLGRVLSGWALGGTYRYTSGQLWTPFEDPFTSSYCNDTFNNNYFSASACRPFMGNPAAPVTAVGQCTNAAAADCGLIDFNALPTVTPIAASAVHWIINNNASAAFFKTPYGNVPRNPGVRGDAVNTVNLNLIKNTRVSERVNLRLEANVYNLFNHQFLGTPAADITSDGAGVFGTTAQNDSGGVDFDSGAGVANPVGTGLAQRRVILGAHIIF